ncbi:energy transducer TonB [Pseudomonas brassicacearum]|uniref:energy transducer TonB n=1 Tax=Pseudomonas brassicacearum TaxID=930166 RepID=UPI00042EC4C1|nr:energy transducer TonB [Pseudomonas brassicacearum]AHL34030.1 energy transducer TonB [Pseudomonas brassicacearum]
MTAMIMHTPSLHFPALTRHGVWRNSLAAGLAVALHVGAVGLLVLGWTAEKPAAQAPRVLHTQLVMLPASPVPVTPAPAPAPVAAPPVESAPVPVEMPRPAAAKPVVDPRVQAQRLEQATLARKRVEDQKREQQAQQQRERQESERRQHEAEQKAAERQRQAQQVQALAQQRAEQARLAAADSRSYQPLSKQAPDYPQRALDKGLEGDCTVEYSVTPDGRIDSPKVLDGCHPLFIRPSLAAAQTFRYQPRIIEGKAVTVPAVRNTFHYRIK